MYAFVSKSQIDRSIALSFFFVNIKHENQFYAFTYFRFVRQFQFVRKPRKDGDATLSRRKYKANETITARLTFLCDRP